MARQVLSTENALITVDSDNEVITVITDKDIIVRVFVFDDRVIVTSNKELLKHPDSDNILVR